MSLEEKTYNGELRQLYNDIDKRLAVLENNYVTTWRTHDREAKEHRQYVHDSFHDLKTSINAMLLKLNSLPCESRAVSDEHTAKALCARFDNIDKNNKAVWGVLSVVIFGWLTTAWKVLFSK